MPRVPPPPGYHRPNVLLGWPSAYLTPAMLAVADARRYDDLWRALQRHTAAELVAGRAVRWPMLGTFTPFVSTRAQRFNFKTWAQFPNPNPYGVTFRPTHAFRRAVSGRASANDPPTYDLDLLFLRQVADLAKLPFGPVPQMYRLMGAIIVKIVSRGSHFDAPGIGTFVSAKRFPRVYRNWRTGVIAVAPVTTLPRCRTSPLLRAWMLAGILPLDL